MLIHIVKFIHLVFALGLLGLAIYCLLLIGSKKFGMTTRNHRQRIIRSNKILLLFSLLAMITGSLLVIPKHFTFHTPWIQAAYILLLVFGVGIALLTLLKRKRVSRRGISNTERFGWLVAYCFLIMILIGIVHDAVMKATFLF